MRALNFGPGLPLLILLFLLPSQSFAAFYECADDHPLSDLWEREAPQQEEPQLKAESDFGYSDQRDEAFKVSDQLFQRLINRERELHEFWANREPTGDWQDEAQLALRTQVEMAYLLVAEPMWRQLGDLRRSGEPIPVFYQLSDFIDEATSSRLPVRLRDLENLEDTPELPNFRRLRNMGLASLQLAKEIPFEFDSNRDEVEFVIGSLTNKDIVRAVLASVEAENRQQKLTEIREALQKMYSLQGFHRKAEYEAENSARESFLEEISQARQDSLFDPEAYPIISAFLKEAGAQALEEFPEQVDLSHLFDEPKCQHLPDGTASFACTAFAVIEDMRTHPGVPKLSKGHPYGLAVANLAFYDRMLDAFIADYERIESELRQQRPRLSEEALREAIAERINADPVILQRWRYTQTGFASMASIPMPPDVSSRLKRLLGPEKYEKAERGQLSGTIPPVMMLMLQEISPALESDFPWPQILAEDYSEIPPSGYRIGSFIATYTDPFEMEPAKGVQDFDFYRLLLANGIPVTLAYNTDARYAVQDWFFPVDMAEDSEVGGHIVNVVGYGVERNPLDGQPTAYLLIRDSLQKEAMHFKVPAHQLLPRIQAAYRVTSVVKD